MLQEPLGDEWSVNTLDRATKTGQSTYSRALARKIEWPKPKQEPKPSVVGSFLFVYSLVCLCFY